MRTAPAAVVAAPPVSTEATGLGSVHAPVSTADLIRDLAVVIGLLQVAHLALQAEQLVVVLDLAA